MREIKFRCWDTGINFMYYDTDSYNIYNENDNWLHSGYEDKYGTWHQNILMQYTGLKDKNGIEIYEFMEIDDNFEVSFKDGCYVLINISNGDIILLYNYLKDKNGQVTVTKEFTKI